MALTFRQMGIDDIPATFEVRLSTVENAITMAELDLHYGVTPESLADAMRSDVAGWLCADRTAVVGFAMGDRRSGEVLVVAVRPEYEGRGIGRALLARVQAWLFDEGHQALWLLANPDPKVRASGFYRRLGWRATGRRRGADEVLKLRRPGGGGRRAEDGGFGSGG